MLKYLYKFIRKIFTIFLLLIGGITLEEKNIEILKMELDDLEKISSILTTDFDDFWNYNILKQELCNTTSKYIVAKYNDEIIGFAGIIVVLDEADISNIVVKKNYRNKKIGSLLLANLINLALENGVKSLFLEVKESNFPAIHLYEKFGFSRFGLRKNYYNNTENAVLMRYDVFDQA